MDPNEESPATDRRQEVVQEYVHSAGQTLRVESGRGVLRGVKLLGLRSRNGRRYEEPALKQAVGLYEGAKVNVNHPERDPLAPRDYRDRLGVVRNVRVTPGEGLFGDLHYNPSHPLAEQLAWDAEHAPENVGLSHNVLARTRRDASVVVVEAITRVRSVDLVADPATTNGLFEHRLPDTDTDAADGLRAEVASLREQLEHAEQRADREARGRQVERLLREQRVQGETERMVMTEAFARRLYDAPADELGSLVAERLEAVREDLAARKPRSREQAVETAPPAGREGAASFVEAITRRR